MPKFSDEQYSEEETTARAEAALKLMLSTPPKPHKEMKVGKRKVKASTKPTKQRGRPKAGSEKPRA